MYPVNDDLDDRHRAAIWHLAIDAATAEMVTAFRAAGIHSILLKGAAIAKRLYDEPSERPYGDFDLLVELTRYADAGEIARGLGYRHALEGTPPHERPRHADTWQRGPLELDLHHRLYWFRGEPSVLWDAFSTGTREIRSGATEVTVLSDAALALVIAAHRVQHGRVTKAARDLEQALARFDREIWDQARDLARRLDMLGVLGAGLRTTTAGRALAIKLELPDQADLETQLRLAGKRDIRKLSRLRGAESTSAAARIVFEELFPTPAFMRHTRRFARRGRRALILAYVYRIFHFACLLPGTLAHVMAARRHNPPSAPASP
jgi:hypothetical protein